MGPLVAKMAFGLYVRQKRPQVISSKAKARKMYANLSLKKTFGRIK